MQDTSLRIHGLILASGRLLGAKPWLVLRMLLRELRRRLYANESWFGFQFDLTSGFRVPASDVLLEVRELMPSDLPVLLNAGQAGFGESECRDVAVRLLSAGTGLPTCYVGITAEKRPCCMCWLIRPSANRRLVTKGFPALRESEVLLENIWTLPEYRGKRLMAQLTLALFDKAKREGARRAFAYIRDGNRSSLAGTKAIGWEICCVMRVRHCLFRRRTSFEPL